MDSITYSECCRIAKRRGVPEHLKSEAEQEASLLFTRGGGVMSNVLDTSLSRDFRSLRLDLNGY